MTQKYASFSFCQYTISQSCFCFKMVAKMSKFLPPILNNDRVEISYEKLAGISTFMASNEPDNFSSLLKSTAYHNISTFKALFRAVIKMILQ